MGKFLENMESKSLEKDYFDAVAKYLPIHKKHIEVAANIYKYQVAVWAKLFKDSFDIDVCEASIVKIPPTEDYKRADEVLNIFERIGFKPSKAFVDEKTGEIILIK
jgi:hypothetical protein